MHNASRWVIYGLLALSATLLAACSTVRSVLPDHRYDYQHSQSVRSLEVPPDLTAPSAGNMAIPNVGAATSYSQYTTQQGGQQPQSSAATPTVLPQVPGMQLKRIGNARWLVVKADPQKLWPKVRDFWLQQGLKLKRQDPTIGVMETDWAESRPNVPLDPIHALLSKLTGSSYTMPIRDKFLTRLERGSEPGTTDVYITQYGMKEVSQGENGELTTWEPRAPDRASEAVMLTRLMAYLGMNEKQAKVEAAQLPPGQPQAQLVRDNQGNLALVLDQDFEHAWQLTGIALDQSGFTVQKADRPQGVYYVRYRNPYAGESKSWFSKLAFWKKDYGEHEYQVALNSQGTITRIMVKNKDGQPDNSDTARHVLTLLQGQLKY